MHIYLTSLTSLTSLTGIFVKTCLGNSGWGEPKGIATGTVTLLF